MPTQLYNFTENTNNFQRKGSLEKFWNSFTKTVGNLDGKLKKMPRSEEIYYFVENPWNYYIHFGTGVDSSPVFFWDQRRRTSKSGCRKLGGGDKRSPLALSLFLFYWNIQWTKETGDESGTDGCDYPTVVSSVASLHRFSQLVSNYLRKVVFEADFRLTVKLSH